MSASTKTVAKKNELKIFKTRKEIKEAEIEGDKTSPANGPARPVRNPLVHTKRAGATTSGVVRKTNGTVTTPTTNKLAKQASPEVDAVSKAVKEKRIVAAAKPGLSNPTPTIFPKVATATPKSSSFTCRKSNLPTTTATTFKPAIVAAKAKPENPRKEQSPLSPAKRLETKAKSMSPVKGIQKIIKGVSRFDKKTATSVDDLTSAEKLSSKRANKMSGGEGHVVARSNKSSKPAAQGTDREERVSQTIHMEKKQTANEGFAEAIFKPKSAKHFFLNSETTGLANNKPRDTAGDECPNSRDLFVYLNQDKQNATATLNLGRSKAKKMISNSTSDLDRKPTKHLSLDSTNNNHENHKFCSASNQQLSGRTASSSDLLHAKFNQLKKSQPLSEEDLSDSLTSSTLTYAVDGIGSCRTLPKFPRDSPPLSVHVEEEVEGHQGSNNMQIVGKAENKSTTSSKLADKLSRSFFDLTQGSQDRLQKWKSKLQKQYGQHHQRSLREREKDTSEPPPRNRKMCTLGGAVPASSEMEILVDWTSSGPNGVESSEGKVGYRSSRQPRPLRSTHSASNAMSLAGKLSSPANLDSFKQTNNKILTLITSSANPLHKSNSLRESCTIQSSTANVKSPVCLPSDNYYSSATMEHRTLRQREQNISATASKNFQQLLQSIEGYSAKNSYPPPDRQQRNGGQELPPPARIMPFSGIKPQDNGNTIHRPIAFRPIANGGGSKSGNSLEHRQSVGSELSTNFSISSAGQTGVASKKGTIEHHKQTLKDHSRSIGNLVSATVTAPSRPGNNTDKNSTLQNASTSHSTSSSHLYNTDQSTKFIAQQNGHHYHPKSSGNEENDYDTVPEFIDQKCFLEGDSIGNNSETYSLIYPYQNITNGTNKSSMINGGSKQRANNFQTSNSTISSRNTSSHSSGSSANNNAVVHSPIANKKSVNGSQSQQNYNRHSGGIHITPSPSDSGIVDYETLIRDKENELSTVRHAMEQNEEVLIRVYQEKERQFKEQIGSLKQKLQDTQQHESSLYQQLCQSDDIRQQLQNSVRMLTEDRNTQQRKCQRMEKELDGLRNKVDNLERLQKSKPCTSTKCSCNADNNSVNGSIYENGGEKNRPPVPAPRSFKDGHNQELRTEVDDLRGEICNLRDQLNTQIHIFTKERRRWEQERQQQNAVHKSPPADLLPNVISKPTALSALYGAPFKQAGEVIMSNDRLI